MVWVPLWPKVFEGVGFSTLCAFAELVITKNLSYLVLVPFYRRYSNENRRTAHFAFSMANPQS